MSVLLSLLREAAGDAGFDLEHDLDADWQQIGVSGVLSAMLCDTPGSLFRSPRRLELLLTQLPPLPEKTFAERLAEGVDWQQVARYSSASEREYWGWKDQDHATPAKLAEVFLDRFPRLALLGYGEDWSYVG